MADRRSSHLTQHRSPSFSQQPSPPVPSDAASSRPSTKRSVSGSAQSRPPSSFPAPQATQASPISSTHALSQSSSGISNPVLPAPTKVGFFTPQRSSTAFPAVAGMSSIEQSTWSEASPPINTASPSSVWNGRPPSTMDGDAVTTASASNVSTPGRAPTALDAKDVSVNAPIFTPSPLLPQDGSAWSIGRPVSLTWANDLSARPPPPTELVTDSPASSPSATKRATVKDSSIAQNNASSPSASLNKGGAPAAASKDSASTASPSTKKEPAAPVPKRAPIRSTTLDPRHLAAKRRPSTDIDDDAVPSGQPATGEDEELIDELSSLTIPSADATVSNAIPPQHGYSSPPAFLPAGHHAHRPSGSFPPPPFSPGEAFMHPAPYLPGSGARSPDGYTHGYQGMHPAMAPIDMSGYESYRTTPDPYAPTMPGRAIFASPGSQGSTPQSPSFGPAPLGPHFNPSIRNGEALFYPGVVPGFGPPAMAGGMASPVRPVMPPPGPGQYSFGPGLGVEAHSSQLAQSPMVAPGVPLPVGGIMPSPSSPSVNAPPMSPNGSDSRSSHSISERSLYGPHSRMPSSGAEPFGPGMMSPRPPFAMTNQAGPFVPGQHPMHGMMAAGPMMPWNGRFHDHRRVPTGPGGVMAPVGGYSLAMGMAGGPMDMHYGRNGPGFYGGGPFHPAGPGGNASISGPGSSNGNTTHSRSPILEEFRSRHAKNRKFELADIYGSVVEFSSDQHGSRFIQEKLDTATAEEKQTLFDEVLPHTRQLMSDVFGNYVVQKMLEHGDDTQRELLSKEMEGHVLSLSLGTYGCRVIQKAFDHISSSQREKLAQELDGHIMQCVRDQNANHVVQKVIERVDPTKIAFVPTTFVGHVPGLASHCYSCRVLQRTFEYCTEEQSRPLLDELHAEAVSLMQHQYGNYVVQWVLQRGQERDKREVVDKIKGRVLVLSRHKFASNVIEVVVRTATPSVLEELLEEILTPSTDGVTPAGVMTKDQFANYVLQRFFEQSNAKQKARLVEVIRPSLASARRLPGGVGQSKHLVAIERLIEGWTGQEGQ